MHKLSNDISLISNSLSLDIIIGLRGIFFVLGGAGYIIYTIP